MQRRAPMCCRSTRRRLRSPIRTRRSSRRSTARRPRLRSRTRPSTRRRRDMTERLTRDELEAQHGAGLPDKEAMTLLDDLTGGGLLTLNVDLAIDADLAAPIDAAVAANANVAAP